MTKQFIFASNSTHSLKQGTTDLIDSCTVLLTSPVTTDALTFLSVFRPNLSHHSALILHHPIRLHAPTQLPFCQVTLPPRSRPFFFFLTLLLVSLSSAWDKIGVSNAPLLGPIPLPIPLPETAPVPVSAVDFFCGAPSAFSPAPACRCLWRKQSWQREGSKMLGWNLGQMGSSPQRAMVHTEGKPAHSLHPEEKTEI